MEVMVHPAFSCHFGGRWGVVLEVETKLSEIPYRVSFDGNRPFYFGRRELLTRKEFEELGKIPCPICSDPVTDMKAGYCERCKERDFLYGY